MLLLYPALPHRHMDIEIPLLHVLSENCVKYPKVVLTRTAVTCSRLEIIQLCFLHRFLHDHRFQTVYRTHFLQKSTIGPFSHHRVCLNLVQTNAYAEQFITITESSEHALVHT